MTTPRKRDQILAVLRRAGGPMSPSEIADHLPGMTSNQVSGHLTHLRIAEAIERVGEGRWQATGQVGAKTPPRAPAPERPAAPAEEDDAVRAAIGRLRTRVTAPAEEDDAVRAAIGRLRTRVTAPAAPVIARLDVHLARLEEMAELFRAAEEPSLAAACDELAEDLRRAAQPAA